MADFTTRFCLAIFSDLWYDIKHDKPFTFHHDTHAFVYFEVGHIPFKQAIEVGQVFRSIKVLMKFLKSLFNRPKRKIEPSLEEKARAKEVLDRYLESSDRFQKSVFGEGYFQEDEIKTQD